MRCVVRKAVPSNSVILYILLLLLYFIYLPYLTLTMAPLALLHFPITSNLEFLAHERVLEY